MHIYGKTRGTHILVYNYASPLMYFIFTVQTFPCNLLGSFMFFFYAMKKRMNEEEGKKRQETTDENFKHRV